MPFGLGATESLVILGVIFLFFGAKRLPAVGGAMGKGILEFKRNIQDVRDSIDEAMDDDASETPSLRPTGTDDGSARKLSE